MALGIVTPPDVLPVSLAEAKAHLRVSYTDDDEYISDLIEAATGRLDGAYGLLGRCILTQTWKATMPVTSATITLPLGPHQSVDAINYFDEARTSQEIDPAAYVVDNLDTNCPAVITRTDGTAWPRTVSITFTAGYGDDETFTPGPIKQAILLDVSHMFENREATTTLGFLKELPLGYDHLIAPYRAVAF